MWCWALTKQKGEKKVLSGSVLITGGAGFLGRGIMRRAKHENWPTQFTVYSRDEQKHQAARLTYPEGRYIVGDVLDTSRLHMVMQFCDTVIHTAAIKYIPECEAQPSEAIRVNIDGTRSVIEAAKAAGVKRVVVISTDKAAQPLNTYGMTKAIAERLVHETLDFPSPSGTEFVAVRYGNMIGSTGSIWPVFKQQLRDNGRVKVTDSSMTRFFIPVDDAIDLIVAAASAPAGTTIIPSPYAVNIGDLASWITANYGATDEPEIIGLRPGEKSHEIMASLPELDRMEPWQAYWMLHGPTVRLTSGGLNPAQRLVMSSDMAKRIAPPMWVEYAKDSESV